MTASMSLRGATAVVGIGQTEYFKRGAASDSEAGLAVRAVVAACEDAGIDPRDVDGFASYGGDHNSGPAMMVALGTREQRWSSMVWGGGGGGLPGALGLAASAVISGQARYVVVLRAMAQAGSGRLREAVTGSHLSPQYSRNGVQSAGQIGALRSQRMIEVDGVPASTLRALALASYYHAQRNPAAYAYGSALDEAAYDQARRISEPFRLYDCSRENDAAVAVLLAAADEAKDLVETPAYVLSAPMGMAEGWGEIEESVTPYTTAGFGSVARRLWAESGYGPREVDVVQLYVNFTGPAVAAMIDHGFCTAETAGDFLTFENLIAPDGALPVNTSGGDLAEGFIHGMGLVSEAVRQIRGTSTNQVPGASLSLVTGGPLSRLVSSALLGSAETLS